MISKEQLNSNLLTFKKRNINVKTIKEPVIKAKLSKSKLPIIKYKELYLHSPYDPVKEASTFVKVDTTKDIIIVCGLGYGYHIRQIITQLKTHSYIIIFEKSFEILYSAMCYANLDFMADKRIFLYTGDDEWKSFLSSLNQVDSLERIQVIYLQNEYAIFKEDFDRLLKKIKEVVKQKIQNKLTNLEFNKLWLKNTIDNLRFAEQHNDIKALFNKFTGKRALVVSAGPSLSQSLSEIKLYKDYFFILATDTAMPVLTTKGIIADFVISLDSQIYNLEDFITTGKNKVNIIYALSTNAAIPRWNKERHFYFAADENNKNSFINWLSSKNIKPITKLTTGASVASATIEIARLLGFKSIVLIGQDLCYKDNITHSKETALYNNLLIRKQNKVNTIHTLFYRIVERRQPFFVGNKKTDFILNNLLKWLGEYANIYQKEENGASLIVNATKDGIPIPNIKTVELKNIIKDFSLLKDKTQIKKIIFNNTHKEETINKQNLVNLLNELFIALVRFVKFIEREEKQGIIQVNIILRAKLQLEQEFSFLEEIFKARSFLLEKDIPLYINAIKNDLSSIINKVYKLIKL